MSERNDGGAAFPCAGVVTPDGVLFEGVSVRDYFAAKAMQGDWANAEAGVFSNSATVEEIQQRCELYYRTADAMLRAREVKQ